LIKQAYKEGDVELVKMAMLQEIKRDQFPF
jgi:hypothetical protein